MLTDNWSLSSVCRLFQTLKHRKNAKRMTTDFNISSLKETISWNWLMFNILIKCTFSLERTSFFSFKSQATKWNVSFSKLVEIELVVKQQQTVVSKVLFYSQFLTSWEFKLKNLQFLQIRPLIELVYQPHKKKVVYYWYHVCKNSQRLRTEFIWLIYSPDTQISSCVVDFHCTFCRTGCALTRVSIASWSIIWFLACSLILQSAVSQAEAFREPPLAPSCI